VPTRIHRATLLAVLLAAAAGCLDRSDDPGSPLVGHDTRFVGAWSVDQPNHATYEATLYELRSDGTLAHGATVSEPPQASGYETGTVASAPAGGVMCRFNDRWHSQGTSRLVVAGACSDESARDIVLRFAADPAQNASDAQVVIESVGGEVGWVHPGFDWRFRRCADPARCLEP
jgi:hypothetical protein